MASVTQKVPSYVLGMSTQPDEKKIPGQVVDLVTVSYTHLTLPTKA